MLLSGAHQKCACQVSIFTQLLSLLCIVRAQVQLQLISVSWLLKDYVSAIVRHCCKSHSVDLSGINCRELSVRRCCLAFQCLVLALHKACLCLQTAGSCHLWKHWAAPLSSAQTRQAHSPPTRCHVSSSLA